MTNAQPVATEPDYTLTIIEQSGGFVVYEGGAPISVPMSGKKEADDWAEMHRRWYQPRCCICGSAITRPDDPWNAYSVDSYGPDWIHKSCGEKLEYWAGHNEPPEPGPHPVPSMDEIDSFWERDDHND